MIRPVVYSIFLLELSRDDLRVDPKVTLCHKNIAYTTGDYLYESLRPLVVKRYTYSCSTCRGPSEVGREEGKGAEGMFLLF